jgi:hypothetical protein
LVSGASSTAISACTMALELIPEDRPLIVVAPVAALVVSVEPLVRPADVVVAGVVVGLVAVALVVDIG